VTRRHTQEDLGTAGLRPLTNFQAVSKTWRLGANVAARPKRVGYSYRNLRNYQRRILSYIAGPPTAKISSMNAANPVKLVEPDC